MGASQEPSLRTLIVGAGESAEMTVRRMLAGTSDMPGTPVVAVDDDERKVGGELAGIPVAGSRDDIPHLVEEYGADQIVFAIPSATRQTRIEIYDICLKTKARIVTLPNIFGTPISQMGATPLLPVRAADLLSRPEVVLDIDLLSPRVTGRCVLVTGGGGSIGSEICRQLMPLAPRRVVIFDIYENTAYELLRELSDNLGSDTELVVEIGSVRDERRVRELFARYRPDIVFHAAAHKHVPLMEHNPVEAVKNNVFGTLNVANAAHEADTGYFVLISTDKAVNPSSVMGATKRMCELIVQARGQASRTVFAAVRFGNVLGSHGSVIPLFERQIQEGGPVTVTHRDITRYFMTIPEAARLVITAGVQADGGEVFILDMGEPIRVYDLAERLIRLSGKVPGRDIELRICGLRPGEKLYEELVMDDESTLPTEMKGIHLSSGRPLAWDEVARRLDVLARALDDGDDATVAALEEVVPTFTHIV